MQHDAAWAVYHDQKERAAKLKIEGEVLRSEWVEEYHPHLRTFFYTLDEKLKKWVEARKAVQTFFLCRKNAGSSTAIRPFIVGNDKRQVTAGALLRSYRHGMFGFRGKLRTGRNLSPVHSIGCGGPTVLFEAGFDG